MSEPTIDFVALLSRPLPVQADDLTEGLIKVCQGADPSERSVMVARSIAALHAVDLKAPPSGFYSKAYDA